jgi:hypothetical protein
VLAKQHLHIRLVIDHENKEGHACAPDWQGTKPYACNLHEKEKLVSDAHHIADITFLEVRTMSALSPKADIGQPN